MCPLCSVSLAPLCLARTKGGFSALQSVMASPQPTGAGADGFLNRLALAEMRDTNRPPSARPSARPKGSARRTLRFHPNVVTGAANAPDVERTCCENGVTMYTPREEQEAMQRMMVKQHLRECTGRADAETRAKLNAVAADEGWRRADTLWLELRSFESNGLHVSQDDPEAIKARQRVAAQRCQQQPKRPKGWSQRQPPQKPPVATSLPGKVIRHEGSPRPKLPHARPSSPRPSSRPAAGTPSNVLPGRAVRRDSSPRPKAPPPPPRPGSPRRSAPTPTQMNRSPCGVAALRTSTRVVAPPGGGSTIVFG